MKIRIIKAEASSEQSNESKAEISIDPKNISKNESYRSHPNNILPQMPENSNTCKEYNHKPIRRPKLKIIIIRRSNKENLQNTNTLIRKTQNSRTGSIKMQEDRFNKERPKKSSFLSVKNKRIFSGNEKIRRTQIDKGKKITAHPFDTENDKGKITAHPFDIENYQEKYNDDNFGVLTTTFLDTPSNHEFICLETEIQKNNCLGTFDIEHSLTQDNGIQLFNNLNVQREMNENIETGVMDDSSYTPGVLLDGPDKVCSLNDTTTDSEEIGAEKIKKDPLLRSLFDLTKEEP